MKRCEFCGAEADYQCHQCGRYACMAHIQNLRTLYPATCRYHQFDRVQYSHAPDQPPKQEENIFMQAQNADQAKKEGKTFAQLLGKLIVKAPDQDYESVADFGSYFAENVLGYSTVTIANNWTKGFISEWMQSPTKEELDPNRALTVGDMQQLLRGLVQIQPPKEQP